MCKDNRLLTWLPAIYVALSKCCLIVSLYLWGVNSAIAAIQACLSFLSETIVTDLTDCDVSAGAYLKLTVLACHIYTKVNL